MAITVTNPYALSAIEGIIQPPEDERALRLMSWPQRLFWLAVLAALAFWLIHAWRPALMWINGTVMVF